MKHADQGSEDSFEEDRQLFFGTAGTPLKPNASVAKFLNAQNELLRKQVPSQSPHRYRAAEALAVFPARGKPSPTDVLDRRENINSGWTVLKNRLKTHL